jgi:hypothetical protein
MPRYLRRTLPRLLHFEQSAGGERHTLYRAPGRVANVANGFPGQEAVAVHLFRELSEGGMLGAGSAGVDQVRKLTPLKKC